MKRSLVATLWTFCGALAIALVVAAGFALGSGAAELIR